MSLSLSRCRILAFCIAFLSLRDESPLSAASAIPLCVNWTGTIGPKQRRSELPLPAQAGAEVYSVWFEHGEPANSALCCEETDAHVAQSRFKLVLTTEKLATWGIKTNLLTIFK